MNTLMPTTFKRPRCRRQQGSGLIEVLILMFVMSLGMLAMGKIHTVLLRDGGTANSRATAASIAQQKLDDLKGFKWVDDTQANLYSENCGAADVNCFTDIGNDTGGRLSGGALVYPAGNVTVGNTVYTRSWTVQDNYFCGTDVLQTAACSPPTLPDVKTVTVTVTWQDANDADPSTPNVHDAHSVVLRSAIARDDSLVLSFTSGGGSTGGAYGPKVNYVAGTAPDVVPVPIQQGSVNRETTKPLPDVVAAGSSIVTKFETITYNTGGTTTKQQLDDFLTLTCSCKFTSDGAGYTAAYYYWDTDSKSLKVKYPTTTVNKNRGVVNVNGQHPLCNSCCNNHHDTSGTDTAKYDSQRPSADYSSGNHKHYYYVNPSNPAEGLQVVPVATNNVYLEACRYLRVDGVYRLMQDWIAKDLVVLPKDNYLTNSSKLANYQSYIQKAVQYNARMACVDAAGQNSASTTDCQTISQSTAPLKSTLLSTRDLSNVSGSAQLLSRALYIDPVYGFSTPTVLDMGYYNTLAQRIAANQSDSTQVWLDMVPFNEVNTTLLTSWDKNPSNSTVLNVSDQTIVDVGANVIDYYGVYSRGLTNITGAGNADVYAYLLPGNSGLTGGLKQSNYTGTVDYGTTLSASGTIAYRSAIGLDAHDHRSANRLSDFINISSSPTPSITGLVRLGNRLGKLNTVTVQATPSSGGTSIPCSLTGEGTTLGFTCVVSSGFTGTVSASTTTSGDFFDFSGSTTDSTYDTEKADGYTALSAVYSGVTGPVEAGTFWLFSSTAEIRGTITCTPSDTCSQVTISGDNGGTSCTVAGNAISCPVPLTGTGKTWAGNIVMTNNLGYTHTLQASCGTAGTSINLSNVGPTDAPSLLNMCVTAGSAPASCTLDGITVSSGQSIVAFSNTSPVWPQTCAGVSQTRYCVNGILDGSDTYNRTTCSATQVAPVLSWSATNYTVTWGAVSGATSYRIYSCTTTNSTSISTCVPNINGAGTDITATSRLLNPAHKETSCIRVRAIASSGQLSDASSATYCLYYNNGSGGSYTYNPTRP